MSKKRIIWLCVAGILSIAAILDAIRYPKPDAENKQKVQSQNTFPVSPDKEMILVCNAYGGIIRELRMLFIKSFSRQVTPPFYATKHLEHWYERRMETLPR